MVWLMVYLLVRGLIERSLWQESLINLRIKLGAESWIPCGARVLS